MENLTSDKPVKLDQVDPTETQKVIAELIAAEPNLDPMFKFGVLESLEGRR
jgi:hypothetical protein